MTSLIYLTMTLVWLGIACKTAKSRATALEALRIEYLGQVAYKSKYRIYQLIEVLEIAINRRHKKLHQLEHKIMLVLLMTFLHPMLLLQYAAIAIPDITAMSKYIHYSAMSLMFGNVVFAFGFEEYHKHKNIIEGFDHSQDYY